LVRGESALDELDIHKRHVYLLALVKPELAAELSRQPLDVPLLMWDMRRNLDSTPMPKGRCVIQFQYPDLRWIRRHRSICVRSTPASMSISMS
jgi:hypothetical protein